MFNNNYSVVMSSEAFEKLLKNFNIPMDNSNKVFKYLDYELSNVIEYIYIYIIIIIIV